MRRQLVLLITGLIGILFVARVLDSYAVATGPAAPTPTPPAAGGQTADAPVLAVNVTPATPAPVETPVPGSPTTVTPTETVRPTPVEVSMDIPRNPLRMSGTPVPPVAAVVTPAPATSAPPKPALPPIYTVNRLPMQTFIVMPDAVKQHIREIYALGRTLDRNPRAFSKLGDSTILWPHLLAVFDTKKFNLGGYAYLEPSVDFFAGSFSRDGAATRKAFHSWSAFDPMWADKAVCQPNEAPLACELRLNNPAVVIIRLGANDSGAFKLFDQDLSKIITFCVESGVIPVIGTKPDRFESPDNVFNEHMRRIAAEYNVPLWDYDLVAGTVPGRGLDEDKVHMVPASSHDYTLPQTFESGDALHSLTALMMLDALRTEVLQPDKKPRNSE